MPQTEEKSRPYLALIPLGCCLALVLCVFLLAKFPGKPGTPKATEAAATLPAMTQADRCIQLGRDGPECPCQGHSPECPAFY